MVNWSNEIMPRGGWTAEVQGGPEGPEVLYYDDPAAMEGAGQAPSGAQGRSMSPEMGARPPVNPRLDMQNNLSDAAVTSPSSVQEAYMGTLKATLRQNKGAYMVGTFLVGTQNTVSFEGILYEVGNDYVTIYQPGRDRYIVCDIYSLRYMEFYDTRRRERCNELLRREGYVG